MAKLDTILQKAIELGASDVHLTVGLPILIRRFGELQRFKSQNLAPETTKALVYEILTPQQRENFEKTRDLDFSYEIPKVGRFRSNILQQRLGIDAVFRCFPPEVPTIESLGLPPILREFLKHHQGLIMITGPTGQGKTSTLAALVNEINSTRAHHILTIEDPIEYVHPLKKGVVNQREVGIHTKSFANALRAALRENPDVIVVGEMRDLETISLAISASETGHLVIGTMMTSSAHKTVDRIIDSFPPNQQSQIRSMVSESLKAVISQRLVKNAEGTRLIPVVEILIGTLSLANLIRDGKTFQIPSLMQTGKNIGMKSMDDALLELLQEGKITPQIAFENATNLKLFAQYLKEPATAGSKEQMTTSKESMAASKEQGVRKEVGVRR